MVDLDMDAIYEPPFWILSALGWVGGFIVWSGFFQVGKIGSMLGSLGGGDIVFSPIQKWGALAVIIIGIPIASYILTKIYGR